MKTVGGRVSQLETILCFQLMIEYLRCYFSTISNVDKIKRNSSETHAMQFDIVESLCDCKFNLIYMEDNIR